ncbi:hypothetical protein LAZ67_6000426 [Cordylochernes scorpioides]|uniref:Uncharacterized protein n=1 Tax=Cordylochernes scorpioides TaxID=51811 RepID=A0ABY6KIL0_9ARAC|nr:hypothetical protein LAZ67_6000426 [Cordylochernes scorpioides]
MEKIILRRLTYHLDTRNLLPKEQYGFRKGHGTIDQLLFFTQKVKDAQNRKPTNHTIAAFLDLTQAFDKVWKNKLITKLYKHFKIDGKAITWINDFLNTLRNIGFTTQIALRGKPPIKIDMIALSIKPLCQPVHEVRNGVVLWLLRIFASVDIKIVSVSRYSFTNLEYLDAIFMRFSFYIHSKTHTSSEWTHRLINKQQLQYNKHPKYLGYTLDPEINSSKHIEEVIRKGRDRLKILKYISGREWGADATTLKLTYTSLIRPILEYGYQIYGTASETNLKSPERIQLSAARIITGLQNTCPNDIVLYEADIMPLKDRRSYNLPKYINKIKSYGNKHRTSKSAIQHLSHTGELRDKVSRNIIGYLQKLSKTSKIHLQWIPSHVGIEGNEAADVLAKKGTKKPLPQKNKLTFKEIETIAKTKINKNWRIPPKHSWYSGVNPGEALKIRNRQHQTTLTRFRTGHLKPLKIENNNKIYPTCLKCSLVPAAPEHILACIRCTKQDLWERPLLIIKQLEEHELMEFSIFVDPDNCQVFDINVRRLYKIQNYYLEDMVSLIMEDCRGASKPGYLKSELTEREKEHFKSFYEELEQQNKLSAEELDALKLWPERVINMKFIRRLINSICDKEIRMAAADKKHKMGAILVFLPGWNEITALKTDLETHRKVHLDEDIQDILEYLYDSGSEIDDEVKDPDYENSASDELEFEEEEREEIPAKRPRLEVAPVRMLTTCRDTSTAAAGSNVAAGTWRKDDPSPPTPPPFTARPGLNLVGDVSSPFDAFSLFFTENIFKSIKEEQTDMPGVLLIGSPRRVLSSLMACWLSGRLCQWHR